MTKYYNTQRPIGPGNYPKPQDNKVIEIKNFDKKKKSKMKILVHMDILNTKNHSCRLQQKHTNSH